METPDSITAKGAAGQYFDDLVKACEDHFMRVYPGYMNNVDHGTVMCLPTFTFSYDAPTGQASGAKPLAKIEEDAIRGDDAELKLFHCLEKFGKQANQPMFVISQLKLLEFCKNVLQQRLPEDHPVFRNDFTGEIDFMIIHRRIGVILMEVKSGSKFHKRTEKKAKGQLQNAENIVRALLPYRDDNTVVDIPVYKVIAMPDLCENSRGNEERFIHLRANDVKSSGNFCTWWNSKFSEKQFEISEKSDVQSLFSIFVGQRSEVSSMVLWKVYNKINKQIFLEKSFKKQDDNGSCQEVSKTADHEEQVILKKQFQFLNPGQLCIWNGATHQFFNGSSGSGKTILLQFKALECAKSGQKVIVVAPKPLTSRYKKFLSENGISSEITDVISPKDFFYGKYIENYEEQPFHFFADEFQTFQNIVPELMTLLEKLMSIFTNTESVCCIAYDYMQKIASPVNRDVSGGLVEGGKFRFAVGHLCENYNFVHATLTTVVRSTLEIYIYVQDFIKRSLDEMLEDAMGMKHIDEKTKKSWRIFVDRYEVSNHLGHRVCGPSVSEVSWSTLDDIVCIIEKEVERWTTETIDQVGALNRVSVLVSAPHLKEQLSQVMTSGGIPVCDVESQENAVIVDLVHKTHSFEWPVVIALPACYDKTNLLANYTMFTRAITRLVVVTTMLDKYGAMLDK